MDARALAVDSLVHAAGDGVRVLKEVLGPPDDLSLGPLRAEGRPVWARRPPPLAPLLALVVLEAVARAVAGHPEAARCAEQHPREFVAVAGLCAGAVYTPGRPRLHRADPGVGCSDFFVRERGCRRGPPRPALPRASCPPGVGGVGRGKSFVYGGRRDREGPHGSYDDGGSTGVAVVPTLPTPRLPGERRPTSKKPIRGVVTRRSETRVKRNAIDRTRGRRTRRARRLADLPAPGSCRSTTQYGRPCQKPAQPGRDVCSSHDESNVEQRRRNARAGRVAHSPATLEIGELKALARNVKEGRVTPAMGTVLDRSYNTIIRAVEQERKVRETEELEERLASLEGRGNESSARPAA